MPVTRDHQASTPSLLINFRERKNKKRTLLSSALALALLRVTWFARWIFSTARVSATRS